jgi:hypothetical protein
MNQSYLHSECIYVCTYVCVCVCVYYKKIRTASFEMTQSYLHSECMYVCTYVRMYVCICVCITLKIRTDSFQMVQSYLDSAYVYVCMYVSKYYLPLRYPQPPSKSCSRIYTAHMCVYVRIHICCMMKAGMSLPHAPVVLAWSTYVCVCVCVCMYVV